MRFAHMARKIYPRTKRARLVEALLAAEQPLTIGEIAEQLGLRPLRVVPLLRTLQRDHGSIVWHGRCPLHRWSRAFPSRV